MPGGLGPEAEHADDRVEGVTDVGQGQAGAGRCLVHRGVERRLGDPQVRSLGVAPGLLAGVDPRPAHLGGSRVDRGRRRRPAGAALTALPGGGARRGGSHPRGGAVRPSRLRGRVTGRLGCRVVGGRGRLRVRRGGHRCRGSPSSPTPSWSRPSSLTPSWSRPSSTPSWSPPCSRRLLGRAFFGDAFPVTTGTGAGTASEVGSGASAGTIGSAPMSGVERRLARSPDARAAPAARAP